MSTASGVMLFGAFLPLILVDANFRLQELDFTALLTIAALGALVAMGGWLFAIPALLDILRGRVSMVEGAGRNSRVKQRMRNGSYRLVYHYQIGARYFLVHGESAYEALVDGFSYRAYYAPITKKLVNIEPLQ